jgi:hypothetical protein
MHLERYELRIEGDRHFFFSEGPDGRIEKVVSYTKFQGIGVYNLAFGDWNEVSGRLDDLVITNNGDTQKVLATVAASVIYFMSEHPYATTFATGSTPSRTRLYQIGIRKHLIEISFKFEVRGFKQFNWEPFRPGRNYEAFLILHKNL